MKFNSSILFSKILDDHDRTKIASTIFSVELFASYNTKLSNTCKNPYYRKKPQRMFNIMVNLRKFLQIIEDLRLLYKTPSLRRINHIFFQEFQYQISLNLLYKSIILQKFIIFLQYQLKGKMQKID